MPPVISKMPNSRSAHMRMNVTIALTSVNHQNSARRARPPNAVYLFLSTSVYQSMDAPFEPRAAGSSPGARARVSMWIYR